MSRSRTRMTNYDIPRRARHDPRLRATISQVEGETYPIAFPTAAILDKMYEVVKGRGEERLLKFFGEAAAKFLFLLQGSIFFYRPKWSSITLFEHVPESPRMCQDIWESSRSRFCGRDTGNLWQYLLYLWSSSTFAPPQEVAVPATNKRLSMSRAG